MQKVLTVAKREFQAAVMTKAFLISLIMMPILMGGSLLIQYLFRDVKSLKDKTYVVIDRTPNAAIASKLTIKANERNETKIFDEKNPEKQKQPRFIVVSEAPSENTPEAILKQRFALAERVRLKEIAGFLDVGSKVLDGSAQDLVNSKFDPESTSLGSPNQDKHKEAAASMPDELMIRYYSNSPTYNEFYMWAWGVISRVVQLERAKNINVTEINLKGILLPTIVGNKTLPRVNKITGAIEDGSDVNILISFFVPFGIVMLMFMVIMVGATPLMQGVVEEKMQRISEVLLSSAKPFQLMLGKLLGGVAVSLLLGSVYLLGAYVAAWQYNFLEYITPTVIIWFLIYLALAVLMFGSLFVAVGAACTDIKETQSLLMPVMLLCTFPLFFLQNIITEPDGVLATGLSFFPFATPSLMTARIAIPPGVPWWHPWVGVVIVLATTLLCVWVASRIFRVGLLMQGKGASFAEMAKWVMKG